MPEAEKLLGLLHTSEAVEKLTDAELTDAVMEEVWAKKVQFCSREDFLLSQLIDRFEARCGIKRDPESGEVMPIRRMTDTDMLNWLESGGPKQHDVFLDRDPNSISVRLWPRTGPGPEFTAPDLRTALKELMHRFPSP